jgi:DNA-binding LacI/PurR family transcriptional regulator
MSVAKPNIHDVATLADVSKSLVSLALMGSPRVGEESRAKILKAAKTLGYRKNAAARTLSAKRSKTIGVLVLDLHNPVFAEILDGVQIEMRKNGFTTMLVSGGEDPVFEQADIDTLMQFQIEGLILISHRLAPERLAAIAAEVPTVVVTRSDIQLPAMDTVSNDDVAGTGLAVDYLVQLGHTQIVCLSGGENPPSKSRVQGYLQAMKRHNLSASARVVAGGLSDATGYAAATEALTMSPTALVVANDFAAMGAIAAIQEAGLRVPEDISVIGYDGISIGGLRNVNLTTVSQPLAELGTLAATRLVERINNPKEPGKQLKVSAELLVRGTTKEPIGATELASRT